MAAIATGRNLRVFKVSASSRSDLLALPEPGFRLCGCPGKELQQEAIQTVQTVQTVNLIPSPVGEGAGGEGLYVSFGVSRHAVPATACADRGRRPSSGARAPPSQATRCPSGPIGRRDEV